MAARLPTARIDLRIPTKLKRAVEKAARSRLWSFTTYVIEALRDKLARETAK